MTLDSLYKMVAHIYSEQNTGRSTSASFARLVEASGMLTIHHSNKIRTGLTVVDALCKTLNWYFAVLSKMQVKSVENLIYRKYPYACPYCLMNPHKKSECKSGDIGGNIDNQLRVLREGNIDKRPVGLDAWQKMFNDIYPPSVADPARNIMCLFEELGELAEAIRVFERQPRYFAGEAADTFSYLMCIANEHSERRGAFSFETEFLSRYPGLCLECGSRVCICPTVPEATIGRMAKELAIGSDDTLYVDDSEGLQREGDDVALSVRRSVWERAESRLPFDRGEANNALILLCLLVGEAIRDTKPERAEALRTGAIQASVSAKPPGSRSGTFDARPLLGELSRDWHYLTREQRLRIRSTGGLLDDLCHTVEGA